MTDTTTPDADADDQVDAYDPLADLTLAELEIGSRHLKGSIVATITGERQGYEKAMGLVLWLHRRRTNPAASPTDLDGMSFGQINRELGELRAGGDLSPTPRGTA